MDINLTAYCSEQEFHIFIQKQFEILNKITANTSNLDSQIDYDRILATNDELNSLYNLLENILSNEYFIFSFKTNHLYNTSILCSLKILINSKMIHQLRLKSLMMLTRLMKLNFYEEIDDKGFKRKLHPHWCNLTYKRLFNETKKSIIYLINNHSTEVNDYTNFISMLFELNTFMLMTSISFFSELFKENYINQTLTILFNHTTKLDENCYEKLFNVIEVFVEDLDVFFMMHASRVNHQLLSDLFELMKKSFFYLHDKIMQTSKLNIKLRFVRSLKLFGMNLSMHWLRQLPNRAALTRTRYVRTYNKGMPMMLNEIILLSKNICRLELNKLKAKRNSASVKIMNISLDSLFTMLYKPLDRVHHFTDIFDQLVLLCLEIISYNFCHDTQVLVHQSYCLICNLIALDLISFNYFFFKYWSKIEAIWSHSFKYTNHKLQITTDIVSCFLRHYTPSYKNLMNYFLVQIKEFLDLELNRKEFLISKDTSILIADITCMYSCKKLELNQHFIQDLEPVLNTYLEVGKKHNLIDWIMIFPCFYKELLDLIEEPIILSDFWLNHLSQMIESLAAKDITNKTFEKNQLVIIEEILDNFYMMIVGLITVKNFSLKTKNEIMICAWRVKPLFPEVSWKRLDSMLAKLENELFDNK